MLATCKTQGRCATCYEMVNNYDSHERNSCTTDYKKISDTEHQAATNYSGCDHMVITTETHTMGTPANCKSAAYCAACKDNFGIPAPDAHDRVRHAAQAPSPLYFRRLG